MDIGMAVLDGIAATRQLPQGQGTGGQGAGARPATGRTPPKVLVLTTFDVDDYVYDALRAGASGFLLNNLLTDAGVRFVDYESAEYHSAFLDAAYLRMPFSTCWCCSGCAAASRSPETVYRGNVCGIHPDWPATRSGCRASGARRRHGPCTP